MLFVLAFRAWVWELELLGLHLLSNKHQTLHHRSLAHVVGVADDVEDDVDADADLTVFFGGASPDHPNPGHVVCADVVMAIVVVIVPFRTLDLRGFGLHPPQIRTHGTGPITGGVPYHIHAGVSVVMGGAQLHNHHASVLLHSLHDSLTDSKDAAVGVGDA